MPSVHDIKKRLVLHCIVLLSVNAFRTNEASDLSCFGFICVRFFNIISIPFKVTKQIHITQ